MEGGREENSKVQRFGGQHQRRLAPRRVAFLRRSHTSVFLGSWILTARAIANRGGLRLARGVMCFFSQ